MTQEESDEAKYRSDAGDPATGATQKLGDTRRRAGFDATRPGYRRLLLLLFQQRGQQQ